MDDFFASSRKLYRNLASSLREFQFTRNHPDYPHYCIVSHASYSPWRNDPDFLAAYERIRNSTLIDIYRCHEIWKQIGQLAHTPGDILEVGVWRGGSSALIALALAHFKIEKKVYAADTFSGVVKAGPHDTRYAGGEHSDCSESDVRHFLSGVSDRVEVLSGIFPDDFENHPATTARLALTHIDVDTYDSARDVLMNVWPRTSTGGLVIFDDYGFWGCEGITKLVNDEPLADARSFHNLNGHALLLKIGQDLQAER